jgi:hypothetical protein
MAMSSSLKQATLSSLKTAAARAGTRIPPRVLYGVNATANYLATGAWMARHGFDRNARLGRRFEVYDAMAARVAPERVLYLEFGVADGMSMRYWSRALAHPAAALHGFDSFEGLPADWIPGRPAGHFSQKGKAPEIDDPRVRFHRGWFEDTLPGFAPAPLERTVVNLDADLYSSTVAVLEWVEEWLRPGDLLYFDEFNHQADELRAFDEFLKRSGVSCALLAGTRNFAHVAFEVIDLGERLSPAVDRRDTPRYPSIRKMAGGGRTQP